jgi:hypothetical protein
LKGLPHLASLQQLSLLQPELETGLLQVRVVEDLEFLRLQILQCHVLSLLVLISLFLLIFIDAFHYIFIFNRLLVLKGLPHLASLQLLSLLQPELETGLLQVWMVEDLELHPLQIFNRDQLFLLFCLIF